MLLVGVFAEEEHAHFVAILFINALRDKFVVDDIVLRRGLGVRLCQLVKFHGV